MKTNLNFEWKLESEQVGRTNINYNNCMDDVWCNVVNIKNYNNQQAELINIFNKTISPYINVTSTRHSALVLHKSKSTQVYIMGSHSCTCRPHVLNEQHLDITSALSLTAALHHFLVANHYKNFERMQAQVEPVVTEVKPRTSAWSSMSEHKQTLQSCLGLNQLN